MKNILLLLSGLLLDISLSAQANVWMVPIKADNTYLRNPKSTVFDSITIDCPVDGKVFVRFDGNCTSTPGDRIILAASEIPDWRTNDGNTSVIVFDQQHAITCFDHTRVYSIEAGVHTFYAVGQNYVETQGSGYASISGNFTALFMPGNLPDQSLSGIGINECCWNWNDGTHVFPHDSIEVASSGKLLVNFESFITTGAQTQLEHGTSLDSVWGTVINETEATGLDDENFSAFMHQNIIDVDPGIHSVYGLANIITGDSSSSNNYLLGTLSTQFIPDGNPMNQLKGNFFDLFILAPGVYPVSQINLTNTVHGKAWLHLTGNAKPSFNDRIHITIIEDINSNADTIGMITLQPHMNSNVDVNFSLSGLRAVTPGTHTYVVLAEFDSLSTGSLDSDISGMFTVEFLGDPVSSIADPVYENSLSVYPNPTNGHFNIQSSLPDQHDPVAITIFNTGGQQIDHQVVTDLQTYNGNLAKMPDGEYLVRLQQGDRVGVKSLVKSGGQ